jgi:hypothetical protein
MPLNNTLSGNLRSETLQIYSLQIEAAANTIRHRINCDALAAAYLDDGSLNISGFAVGTLFVSLGDPADAMVGTTGVGVLTANGQSRGPISIATAINEGIGYQYRNLQGQ